MVGHSFPRKAMFIKGFILWSLEEELDFRKEIKRKLLLKCEFRVYKTAQLTLSIGFLPLQARRWVMGLAMSL